MTITNHRLSGRAEAEDAYSQAMNDAARKAALDYAEADGVVDEQKARRGEVNAILDQECKLNETERADADERLDQVFGVELEEPDWEKSQQKSEGEFANALDLMEEEANHNCTAAWNNTTRIATFT